METRPPRDKSTRVDSLRRSSIDLRAIAIADSLIGKTTQMRFGANRLDPRRSLGPYKLLFDSVHGRGKQKLARVTGFYLDFRSPSFGANVSTESSVSSKHRKTKNGKEHKNSYLEIGYLDNLIVVDSTTIKGVILCDKMGLKCGIISLYLMFYSRGNQR